MPSRGMATRSSVRVKPVSRGLRQFRQYVVGGEDADSVNECGTGGLAA